MLTVVTQGSAHATLRSTRTALERMDKKSKLSTITYKSRLTQKKLHKKTDAIFSEGGRFSVAMLPW